MSEIIDRGAGTSNLLHTVAKRENRGTLGGTGHGVLQEEVADDEVYVRPHPAASTSTRSAECTWRLRSARFRVPRVVVHRFCEYQDALGRERRSDFFEQGHKQLPVGQRRWIRIKPLMIEGNNKVTFPGSTAKT